MTETQPGISVPSGFTTVKSPTCTAFPMPSGNRTAPLDASAGGPATPAVTQESKTALPPSGRLVPMLQRGIPVRPGYS